MVCTLQTTTSMRKWWVSFRFRGTELLVKPKSVFKSLRNSSFVQNWERLKKLHGLQTKHATMHDSRKATKYDKINMYIQLLARLLSSMPLLSWALTQASRDPEARSGRGHMGLNITEAVWSLWSPNLSDLSAPSISRADECTILTSFTALVLEPSHCNNFCCTCFAIRKTDPCIGTTWCAVLNVSLKNKRRRKWSGDVRSEPCRKQASLTNGTMFAVKTGSRIVRM